MKTPFSTEQFFQVFEQYNLVVFPAQLIIVLLGLVSLWLLHSNMPLKNLLIGSFLGALWIWTGLVYHIAFFSEINPAAFFFGGLFLVEGFLILFNVFKDRFRFAIKFQPKDFAGYFFILFGLVIYPLIDWISDGSFIKTISLGLPCPSVIFTFGFLILTIDHIPNYLLIIPTLWAIVGLSAVVNFGVYQDLMILISAISALVILFFRNKVTIKI
jgi:hypothetical protein